MKIRISYALLAAVALAIGVSGCAPLQASEKTKAATEATISEQPQFTVICKGADNAWACDVLDIENKKVEPSKATPKNMTAIEALIYQVQADVPIHELNTGGPHCWILVAGKYYMTHC